MTRAELAAAISSASSALDVAQDNLVRGREKAATEYAYLARVALKGLRWPSALPHKKDRSTRKGDAA